MPLYRIIGPQERFAEIWWPEDDPPLIERRALTSVPIGASAPFALELAELGRAI